MTGWITAAEYAARRAQRGRDKVEAEERRRRELDANVAKTIACEVNAIMYSIEAGTAFSEHHGRSVLRRVMCNLSAEEMDPAAYASAVSQGRTMPPDAATSARIAEGVHAVLTAKPLLYKARWGAQGATLPGASAASVVEVDEPSLP